MTSLPPSAEPLRASLSDADDRIRLNHWMPPQQGIAPRIRIGGRWINTLWALPIGAAALLCLIALAQSLREVRTNGYEVTNAALALRPNLKVVLMTGYTEEEFPQNIANAGIRILRKPFDIEQIPLLASNVLGRRAD